MSDYVFGPGDTSTSAGEVDIWFLAWVALWAVNVQRISQEVEDRFVAAMARRKR